MRNVLFVTPFPNKLSLSGEGDGGPTRYVP